ncbi:glycosyltransferase [Fictibacillus phosphorivorans]|uniref:glycosyltransferase family protein n=1 Tax=Fictibacillus phosphorivorans TaxID=1221500 RepID=UPI0011A212F9|nr:glycosyltransferase [Fictibacillus phosphorivorans]
MKKLNLLFITKDRSQQLERSSYYLELELAKLTNLTKWQHDGNIHNILSQLSVKPDFILLNDYKPEYRPFIRGLKDLQIPHGTLMHDLHYKLSKRNLLIHQEKPALIFCHYRDAFKRWLPEHINRLVWFPHHVPAQIFHPYPIPKEIPLLLIGATFPHIYPFRHHLVQQFKNDPRFVHPAHPGYGALKKGLTGNRYAEKISKAKIFLTCDSIHHFPLLKYFEVLACGTLLAAPASKELSDLGFIDGKTFAAINELNYKHKIEYFLSNESERNRIVHNGLQLIRQRHTTEIRAKEMVHTIHQYLNHLKK